MSLGTSVSAGSAQSTGDVFDHVLVGIDETPESLVAAAQAGVLRAPGGRVVLLAVAERHLAAHAGHAAADADELLLAGISNDLARARELVDADEAVLVAGRLGDFLRGECERRGATLTAVGVRPHGRLSALAFGGPEVEALHDASCSVLVARPGWGPHRPKRIVAALDGTPESQAAEDVARPLAARLGCELVSAVGLADVLDPAVLRGRRDELLVDTGSVADAVANAAGRESLVVVGHGSGTSGRVVFGARCSVLAVRVDSLDSGERS